MTCCHAPSIARLLLLVLIIVISQPAGTAPVWGEVGQGGVDGPVWTHGKEDNLSPFLSLPPSPAHVPLDQGQEEANPTDSAQTLAILLEALDHPGGTEIERGRAGGWEEGQREDLASLEDLERGVRGTGEAEGKRGHVKRGMDQFRGGLMADDGSDDLKNLVMRRSEEDPGLSVEEKEAPADGDTEHGGKQREEEQAGASSVSQGAHLSLQRKVRGYFKNIDLGLQDNEILPPLKGYKAYNTQLARAGKKIHWQEEQVPDRPAQGGNFMDDFENEGEELEEELEEEEESLSRLDEEARARAEKQEVLRQQEEAERAREEEQRLADIASDMLLQYMGRKQQSYMMRQKSSTAGNTAEDKRSEEVSVDDDDLDQQMIDRLIEISSKLHLPADDVVEIISDVEEKKKKRKELQQQPSNNKPVIPRFRPLVPPPQMAPPIYHYTASNNPKKSNNRWQEDKAKSYKQDYWYKPHKQMDFWYKPHKQMDFWYKPHKQMDYWYKPQKQFLAFPSYPYYQKPYRAYYPVYFPYPKKQFYGMPPLPRDQSFGHQDLDFQPPRRRQRVGSKGRGQGWRQQPAPQLPVTPYISNYILPHPRTYQPLPPPKPLPPARRGRQPPYFYASTTPDDYEEDGLVPQLDSEEELENFIERIYMKRRMY